MDTMKRALYAALLSAAAAAAADVSALGDRLVLDLPESVQRGQRSTAIMEPQPSDDEALFWVGDDDGRIAVYLEALDLLAGEDFEKQARAILDEYKKDGVELEVKMVNPHVVYGLRKNPPEKPTGADMYGVALIGHRDGSMIRLKILFAANHAKTPEKNREWSENVIRSIRFGSGVRPSAARVETISFFGELTLEIPVPEGYVRTTNPGCDFSFTSFSKLGRPGETLEYFGIYLGGHPSFDVKKQEDAQMVKSTFAGKSATWYCTEPKDGVHRADALVCISGCSSGWQWQLADFFGVTPKPPVYSHLIIVAPTAEKRSELINNLTRAKLMKPEPVPAQ